MKVFVCFMLCCCTSSVFAADATSWIFPVEGDYSLGYEYLEDTGNEYGCSSDVYHPGTDINTGTGDLDRGESIRAVANGEIVSDYQSNWGTVIIKHTFKDKVFYSLYGHLDSVENNIIDGASVTVGQLIGQMGDRSGGKSGETCYRDNGSPYDCMAVHLHFEIREDDHPYAEDGNRWCSGLVDKNRSDLEDEYANPIDFVKSEGYSDGTCVELSENFGGGVFCWFSPEGQNNASCQNGIGHKHYVRNASGVVSSEWGFGDNALIDYCNNIDANSTVDIVRYLNDPTYTPGGSDSGGGSSEPTPDPTPDPSDCELSLDADPFVNGTELHIQNGDTEMPANGTVEWKAQLEMRNQDAENCKTESAQDHETVEIDFYISINGGSWERKCHESTKFSNLQENQTHTETCQITLPASGTVRFKTIADANEELIGTPNGGTVSRIEEFEIVTNYQNSDYANSPCGKAGFTIEECAALWFKITRSRR